MVILLTLLDLSAAFDTVDHSFILTHLQILFILDGLSINWWFREVVGSPVAMPLFDINTSVITKT